MDAPPKVLAVLLGNLLRSGFSYTEAGELVVEIAPHAVVIRDSGVGMSPNEVSGLHQPLVGGERSLRGGHGVGTRVEVRLPSARVEPLHH